MSTCLLVLYTYFLGIEVFLPGGKEEAHEIHQKVTSAKRSLLSFYKLFYKLLLSRGGDFSKELLVALVNH